MGIDILGIDIMGVDVLGIDILALPRFLKVLLQSFRGSLSIKHRIPVLFLK